MTYQIPLFTGELMEMLSYQRPADSDSEAGFIARYIDTVPGIASDAEGNRILSIGNRPRVLWSSHTDTVHDNAGFQRPTLSPDGIIKATSDCLGADDGAGVWLMLEMIKAQKEGLYIFHRGEEIGGIGSQYIAYETPELLDDIDCAIALDRAGASDIITHMAGSRTCSNDFAISLRDGLGVKGLKACSGGVFTDTYHYTDLIPECTNISVGYARAHSKHETLDTNYLYVLRDALLRLDTDALITPGYVQDRPRVPDYSRYLPIDAANDRWCVTHGANDTMVDYIRRYPDKIAQLLNDYGIDDEIYNY